MIVCSSELLPLPVLPRDEYVLANPFTQSQMFDASGTDHANRNRDLVIGRRTLVVSGSCGTGPVICVSALDAIESKGITTLVAAAAADQSS